MFRGPVRYQPEELPDDGDAATQRTIERMGEFASADARDSRIRSIAQELRRECRGSRACIAEATHGFVRGRVRFRRDSDIASHLPGVDAAGAEVLIRPVDLLAMPQPMGDCDDFSMLASSILQSAGVPHSFVTVAADRRDPSRYSHVYLAADTERGRMPVDASHGRRPDWEVANLFDKRREWRMSPLTLPVISLGECDSSSGLCDPKFSTTVVDRGMTWWEKLLDVGANIAEKRYGVPPLGTQVIREADGSYRYSRGATIESASESVARAGANVATAFGNIGMGTIALVGLAVIAVALAVGGRSK